MGNFPIVDLAQVCPRPADTSAGRHRLKTHRPRRDLPERQTHHGVAAMAPGFNASIQGVFHAATSKPRCVNGYSTGTA
jgi:hypothetical protein